MRQIEIARRMRFTLHYSPEPTFAGTIGFGLLLIAAAYLGWEFGCYAYVQFSGGF